jgi:hypothetical protein
MVLLLHHTLSKHHWRKKGKSEENPTYTTHTEKFRFLLFVVLRGRLAALRELVRQVMSRKNVNMRLVHFPAVQELRMFWCDEEEINVSINQMNLLVHFMKHNPTVQNICHGL